MLSENVPFRLDSNLDELICGFFHFYGHQYEFKNHLISLNIGKWQEKRLQKSQKALKPDQKRLVF